GTAVDASGNVYVADYNNNRIRKVTRLGVVTTLAGFTGGYLDSTGTGAQFNNPAGVAVDGSGNVYVADMSNHRIRKVTAGGVVTTLAGSGAAAFGDGTGTGAKFSYPTGVAVDASGNVYVADMGNQRIRKVTAGGVVTTFAGASYGYLDGTGTEAQFAGPSGVAVDASGNVYVADKSNQRIRKVTAGGVVTTLAGSGAATFGDGTGTGASFNGPFGVAVDTSGNVYVADAGNNRIRQVTAAGVVTTLAGTTSGFADGPAATAQFNGMTGVAVDAGGNVYVADSYNNRIRKVTAGGVVTTILAQSGLTGASSVNVSLPVTGLAAQTTYYYRAQATNSLGTNTGQTLNFTTPSTNTALASLALSAGTLTPAFAGNTVSYTATVSNATASLTVTPTAAQTNATITVNGSTVASGSPSGAITLVVGANTITVAVTAQDGVTVRNYTVVVTRLPGVPTATTVAATAILSTGATLNASINPGGYADAWFQYTTTADFSGVASVSTLAGSSDGNADGTGAAAKFSYPAGTAVDASGNVYVADVYNNLIRKITPTGVVTTLAGSTPGFANNTGALAKFNQPWGVAVDASGNVYVADYNNSLIRKVTAAGVVTTLAGSGVAGFANGAAATAQFSSPRGVAVDASGNVYVADYNNHRIRKITPTGEVTTLAGSGVAGSANGTGVAAQFNYPNGVAVDASTNVYVGDTANYLIRKIKPTGEVTTLAGSGGAGSANGTGVAAKFNYPCGVAVDASTNVYVADQDNHCIRMVTAAGVVTTLAGSTPSGSVDGTVGAAKFYSPYGVALDASGSVYVGDAGNNRIRKVAAAGVVTTILAQSGLTGA
ncbi:MAG: cadherin-like beta sandwich domain-containing protein, partial [Verrucomicrobiota bacterium]